MADINIMFLGIVSFLMFFLFGGITLILMFMAGKEGRFNIGRFIHRKGIDLLSYERLSRTLSLSKIVWDGKYWKEGKEAIRLGIEPTKGTSTTSEKYNEAISSTARWEGNKRPILMTSQEMFFTWSHGFLDLISKATRFEKLMEKFKGQDEQKKLAIAEQQKEYQEFIDEVKKIKTSITKEEYPKSHSFMDDLLTQVQMGYEGLKIYSIVTADEINKYLEGATPRVLMESREQGKNEGILLMKDEEKKEGVPPMVKAIVISASLIMALVIAYVVITGQNPVEGIKNVLPN